MKILVESYDMSYEVAADFFGPELLKFNFGATAAHDFLQ